MLCDRLEFTKICKTGNDGLNDGIKLARCTNLLEEESGSEINVYCSEAKGLRAATHLETLDPNFPTAFPSIYTVLAIAARESAKRTQRTR
jgi:hypothetical protein